MALRTDRLPPRARNLEVHLRRVARRATAERRALPDALLIGAQKSGTTSLSRYLRSHPDVRSSVDGEVHYFDDRFHRPVRTYRAQFPLDLELERAARRGPRPVVFEKSPKYLFHPQVPARAASVVPRAKLLVLLRNPVDRAISQHRMNVHGGREPLSLAAAIEAEPARIGPELELVEGGHLEMVNSMSAFYSYVARSRYAEQLARWEQHFSRDQMLVVRAEDLFTEPEPTYDRILAFLGLAPHRPEFKVWHPGRITDPVDPADRARLERALAASTERLAAEWDIRWE